MSSQALATALAEAPAGQPALAGADLSARRALAATLGLLISSAVYGYGGLG